MAGGKPLGEFEMAILAAYGGSISAEIKTRTGREASIGAIYTTLSRLEEKGLVVSRLGEATAQRGGRAKRYFRMTAAGVKAFERSIKLLNQMLEGLPGWSIQP